jgi:hypothetical protein
LCSQHFELILTIISCLFIILTLATTFRGYHNLHRHLDSQILSLSGRLLPLRLLGLSNLNLLFVCIIKVQILQEMLWDVLPRGFGLKVRE